VATFYRDLWRKSRRKRPDIAEIVASVDIFNNFRFRSPLSQVIPVRPYPTLAQALPAPSHACMIPAADGALAYIVKIWFVVRFTKYRGFVV
jgi:hypothetical protein